MQGHTDAAASHGQLGYTSLEEGAGEVALYDVVGLLQEAVGIVRVRKVGRSTNHVGHLLSQLAQHGCRGAAGS